MSVSVSESEKTTPLVNPNPSLQSYYASLESRVGYRLLLGGTRHFGYYPRDTYNPFPLSRSLRAMEEQVFKSLALSSGSSVLDAGCGVGHVAMFMARKGLRVQCIDVVDHHIEKASRGFKAAGLSGTISVRKGDYHHLDFIADGSLDGVYTVETFVHATDPKGVLEEFYRVLRPGGKITLYEYDHVNLDKASDGLQDSMAKINQFAAMPANQGFKEGVLQNLIEGTGFEQVDVKDLSIHIRPMLRFFYLLAFLPYLIVVVFGLEKRFINTVTAVQSYRGKDFWRYTAVTATKPFSPSKK